MNIYLNQLLCSICSRLNLLYVYIQYVIRLHVQYAYVYMFNMFYFYVQFASICIIVQSTLRLICSSTSTFNLRCSRSICILYVIHVQCVHSLHTLDLHYTQVHFVRSSCSLYSHAKY